MNNGDHQSMTDEAGILFEPASWQIKFDFINQFILNNNVLISILGDTGSGKTTFAHFLQNKLDQNINTVMLTATPLFDRTEFLDSLSALLDLREGLSIEEIVAHINERRALTLVTVDDAEQLPELFLKEILDALQQQEDNGYFHACLFSDFSLVRMTSRLAKETYQDQIHSLELQPLSESETRAYVMERAGSFVDKPLDVSEERLHQFYQLTEGNIVGINTQMLGFFSKKQPDGFRWNKTVLSYGAIPILLLAAVSLGYFLFSSVGAGLNQFKQLAKNDIDSIAVELPLSSDIPSYQLAALRQPMQLISLQKAALLIQNTENNAEMATDESLVVMDKVLIIPKVILPSVVKKAKQPSIARASGLSHLKKSAHAQVIAPKGQFTIQLMASRDKNGLSRLAKRYSSSTGIKLRRFNSQGVVWYVLTQGEYAKSQLAKNAVANLPKELTHFKPWIRPMGSLTDVG